MISKSSYAYSNRLAGLRRSASRGKGYGVARELQIGLLQMIHIQMAVAARPHEIADLKPALLRNHVREQRVGGDVEGHPEQGIGAALVQLAG